MLDTQGYNSHIKISGDHITIKRFNKILIFGYDTSAGKGTVRGTATEERTRDNFNKSVARARNNIFDIISSNIGQIPTFGDNKFVSPKFVTLTFADNITDVQEANAEFTRFNKRLSWHLYGLRRNVIKYICVPEFQQRGAVHYHVLYFNLPYVDFEEVSMIWGKGYLYIEGVKDGITNYAKYLAKYMNKENSKGEDLYEVYRDRNMLNQKRYFCSRGLKRATVYKLNISDYMYDELIHQMRIHHVDSYYSTGEFLSVDSDYYELENKTKLHDMLAVLIEQHLSLYRQDTPMVEAL